MGLDGVELVMTLEERLGVDIPDVDAQKIETVGDIYMYLQGRLREKNAHPSPDKYRESIQCFFEKYAVGKYTENLQTDTTLQVLFPLRKRRQLWNRFQAETGIGLPKLLRPQWVNRGLWGFAGLYAALLFWGPDAWKPLVFLYGILIYMGILFATRILPLCFPHEWKTLGDFETGTWNLLESGQLLVQPDEDIWPIIQEIVVEQLSVKPEQVTRQARLVKDLGVG